MPDLNSHTLFGEGSAFEVVRWPVGYGSYRKLIEHTLFTGAISLWRLFRWPARYGRNGSA